MLSLHRKPMLLMLLVLALLAAVPRSAGEQGSGVEATSVTCSAAGGCLGSLEEPSEGIPVAIDRKVARQSCLEFYGSLPERTEFFRRVQKPPNLPPERFENMLVRGGIHPRGVVLETEFFELPLRLNATLLQEEAAALLEGEDWEATDAANAAQGVVSRHFRLTHGQGGPLSGPFEEVGDRLARSPYIRTVLSQLGGVIGNTALMSLESGGAVEAHFDTNSYWDARVRLHIPIWTNRKVIFSCGQTGEMQKLHMKTGRVYLFDNHLGHSVQNKGKSQRVHLTVDMVGSRRFWGLVRQGKAIGGLPRAAARPAMELSAADALAPIAVEAWSDAVLRDGGCQALGQALANTAAGLGLREAAARLGSAWCLSSAEASARTRREEIKELQRLVAEASCEEGAVGEHPGRAGERARSMARLVDVADSVAALHRLAEADGEHRTIGGETSA